MTIFIDWSSASGAALIACSSVVHKIVAGLSQDAEQRAIVGSHRPALKLPGLSFSVDDLPALHRVEGKGPAQHDSQVEELKALVAALRAEMAEKDREHLRTEAALNRKVCADLGFLWL
jgi:cell division FtsZ-interacting protein ZapD